jgi:hypothetical protein
MSSPGDAPSGSGGRELAVATRAARIMAWAVAVAGTGGGTLALRDGDLATALVVWTTTLAVAAVLVGTATLMRAVEALTARVGALEELLRDRRT